MTTRRRQLKAHLAFAQDRIADLVSEAVSRENELWSTKDLLFDLGYYATGGVYVQTDAARKAQGATVEAAHIAGRNQALTTVIDALGLKEYASPIPAFREGKAAGYTDPIDAFWADLNTALEVRAERALAAARAAAEVKVTRLTKDAYAPGDRVILIPTTPPVPTDNGDTLTFFGAPTKDTAPKPSKAKKGGKK